MKRIAWRFVFLLMAPFVAAHAQICAPVGISYLVRDVDNKPLADEAFEQVFAQLPKRIGVAQEGMGIASTIKATMALDDDGNLLPPEQQAAGERRVPGLGFYAGGPCRFHLDDVTLKYGRRTMHLIFDLDVTWTEIGSYTIDSLPFQDGIFALGRPQIVDSREVSHAQRVMFVPAEMWKRVDPDGVGR